MLLNTARLKTQQSVDMAIKKGDSTVYRVVRESDEPKLRKYFLYLLCSYNTQWDDERKVTRVGGPTGDSPHVLTLTSIVLACLPVTLYSLIPWFESLHHSFIVNMCIFTSAV